MIIDCKPGDLIQLYSGPFELDGFVKAVDDKQVWISRGVTAEPIAVAWDDVTEGFVAIDFESETAPTGKPRLANEPILDMTVLRSDLTG